jgi:ABC-type transport system involved in multi-copper enzyme maturation permease subunit
MSIAIELTKFELRYQLRSPFFLCALFVFALIHFLAITGTAIHIDVSSQVALNSPFAVLQIELALFLIGILPIIAFVMTGITRDFECATAELVFATPISQRSFLAGRFLGSFLSAVLIGLAGMFGALIGTFMPWLDQTRLGPFSILPWVYLLFTILVPNTFVLCAIFFSVAAMTRSVALTWGAAMVFFVGEVLLNLMVKLDGGAWVALADPSGRMAIAAETRYWTILELNTRMPIGLLAQNRLLWLIVALAFLALVFSRFRLDLSEHVFRFRARRNRSVVAPAPLPAIQKIDAVQRFSGRATGAQLVAQLRMDLACVFRSPLIFIILALVMTSMFAEFRGMRSPVGIDTPLYPLTSLVLPFLRYGMLTLIILVSLWYSGELIHRERRSEIINALPFPDWLMVLAKSITMFVVVNVMMLVAVLTLVTLQTSAGYTNFEPSLYLRSAFIYNGLSYCLLCIPALVIQTLAPNKWVGMLATLVAYTLIMSLGAMGYDHVLYNFLIPEAIYSDMNGFGHFLEPIYTLLAYWGTFSVLILVMAFLPYPRGIHFSFRERLGEVRARFGTGARTLASLAAVAFIALGGWIFYNTNILNEYVSPAEADQRRVDYERAYSKYEDAPAPSYETLEMSVDIFPLERRLESAGSAVLGNHRREPISEFVVSVKPVVEVNQLSVENATLAQSDKRQGFYLFRLNQSLAPGATVKMSWKTARRNEGFVVNPDNEIVANGTFVGSLGVLPVPGYDGERRITDNMQRRKYGLPPAPRTATLGDPARLYKIAFGIDSRTAFDVVLSTSEDQIAIAPGALVNEWKTGGRRYFHYKSDEPILPNLAFCSARYSVARDRWNDVALEIYYDPKHQFNIDALMSTAKRALEYFSKEFAPYQYKYLRIVEFTGYRSLAKFMPGVVPYSESIGFVADLRELDGADYGLMHELAHMWWGDRIVGAQMQGREMLTENMAEYSTQMLFRQYYPAAFINRLTKNRLDAYLNGRSSEKEAEQPLLYADHRGHKGPLAMYALQDLIGKEKVHEGLRNFLQEYSYRTSPCPTAKDLVDALRRAAGDENQQLITDLFERIVLYELTLDTASAREVDGSYEVTIELTARQVSADGMGKESEEPLDMSFDIALFPESEKSLEEVTPIYIEKHRLHSGRQVLKVRTSQLPGIAAVDPFHKMIERTEGNNRMRVSFPSR